MKKLFLVLCVVIMFFGIVGCPSSNDQAATSSFSSTTSTPVTTTGEDTAATGIHAAPEPATLLLLGLGGLLIRRK